MKPLQIALLLLLAVVLSGCKSEPEFTKVSGTVTKNGEPLNSVEVRFVPIDEALTKYNGFGLTDDEGKYTIAIPGREEKVFCVGKCKVTVREGPMPNELRGNLERNEGGGAGAIKRFKASLKNRPIPKDYQRLHSTPLKPDVTAGEFEFPIEL